MEDLRSMQRWKTTCRQEETCSYC